MAHNGEASVRLCCTLPFVPRIIAGMPILVGFAGLMGVLRMDTVYSLHLSVWVVRALSDRI